MDEVRKHIVLLFFLWQKAIMVLPVVLVHASVEGHIVGGFLLAVALRSSILLVQKEHAVVIGLPLVVTEESATSQSCHFGLRLSPYQIAVLFVIHHFSNGIGQQISG
jgi:hypothetical protein